MTQTEDKIDKRFDYLRYINTILIAFILAFSVMCWNGIRNVKAIQETVGNELILIRERQNVNTTNIDFLDKRVTLIESNVVENLKQWIDENYIRKPQK